MVKLEEVKVILAQVLQLGDAAEGFDANTPLLGSIPEFDSMAVVSVITAMEDNFDIFIEDDEIDAEVFETLGTLHGFVAGKVNAL